MIEIYRGLVEDALTLARSPHADIWVVEAGSRGPFAESSRIPGDTREAIARLHGVTASGTITYQSVEAHHEGKKLRLYVVGYEISCLGGPGQIVAGRAIARSHYELVADRRSGLSVGDRLPLGRNIFTVVGLTENQVSSGGDPVVYLTLRDSHFHPMEKTKTSQRESCKRTPDERVW